MTKNKFTVERYMDGFNLANHDMILSCLTDDVVWDLPGRGVRLVGKDAFEREIENPAFGGRPKVTVTRVVEEDDVVVAEGTLQVMRREGDLLTAVFCDVFVMRDARISQLTSYIVQVK